MASRPACCARSGGSAAGPQRHPWPMETDFFCRQPRRVLNFRPSTWPAVSQPGRPRLRGLLRAPAWAGPAEGPGRGAGRRRGRCLPPRSRRGRRCHVRGVSRGEAGWARPGPAFLLRLLLLRPLPRPPLPDFVAEGGSERASQRCPLPWRPATTSRARVGGPAGPGEAAVGLARRPRAGGGRRGRAGGALRAAQAAA